MTTEIEARPMSKLYKRPNGMYYVRYKQHGKFEWKSLKTKDRREAKSRRAELDRILLNQKLRDRQNHHLRTSPPSEINLTIARLKDIYFAWAKDRRRPGTIYHANLELDRFAKHTGLEFIVQVPRKHIEIFQQKMRDEGAAPRTVNKALRTLRAVVNVAIRLEQYDRKNPFEKFDPLPVPKSIPQWLSTEQMHAVMDAAGQHSRDAHLIFALGIYAGLRKEEIIAAQWDWIDFKNRTLYVRGSGTFQIKDNEERAIDLNSTLSEILLR